jgi:hypothetical protein
VTRRKIVATLLILAAIAALAATPLSAGFAVRTFICDAGASSDWVATIFNLRHLISFGVVSVLVFLVFADKPLWVPIALLLALTATVEIEEAIFVSGHCRVRDMIPGVIAIGLGWTVAIGVSWLLDRQKARV